LPSPSGRHSTTQLSRLALNSVFGQSRRAASTAVAATSSSRIGPHAPQPAAGVSPLASSVTPATSRLSSVTWLTTRVSTSCRSAGGMPGSSASSSTLTRRLASGVRSSWLASLTSRRCAASDCCSALSILLNDAASRPSSSWRSTRTRRPGSPVAVTSSATPASRATGARPALATAQPSTVAAMIPIALSTASVAPTLATSISVVLSDSATWRARPGASGVVSTADRVPPTLRLAKNAALSPRATARSAPSGDALEAGASP
jgi:hypothetical protein